ncbi:MAG: isoprenylcysteine carboxylmethyltransferase family protein [Anaerolineales bacterium]
MQEPLLIFLATIGWGALHSLLAGIPAKAAARKWFGTVADNLYRIAFNATAVITLIPVLAILARNPGPVLVRVPGPWWLVLVIIQITALVLLGLSFLQSNPPDFLGLRQLGNAKGDAKLVTTGAYSIVRHPMYTTGLLVLWLFPILTAGTLAFDLGITLYILAGSELEERKLTVEYGEEYRKYKAKVARLIPFLF